MPDLEVKQASIDLASVTPPSSGDRQAALAKQFDSMGTTPPAPSESTIKTGGELSESEFEDNVPDRTTEPGSVPEAERTEEGESTTDEGKPTTGDTEKELSFEQPEDKPKPEVTPNPPFRPAKRNYDQFDPDDVPKLKKLTNFQFDTVKEFARQKAELRSQVAKLSDDVVKLKSGNLPDSWQEHPQAYTLTKEYQDLNTQLTYDNFEESHWEDQLRNIKSGKDWYDIEGYDEKTGQPVFKHRAALAEGQLDVNAEIQVSKWLNNVNANKANRFAQINRIAGSHQQYHNQAIQSLKEAETKFFPSWSDPTKIPPDAKRNMDLVVAATHPAFRNHPSTPLLAKSYAYIQQLIGHIKQLTEEKKLAEDKVQDRIKAGPSNRNFAGVGQAGNGKMVSLADFEN